MGGRGGRAERRTLRSAGVLSRTRSLARSLVFAIGWGGCTRFEVTVCERHEKDPRGSEGRAAGTPSETNPPPRGKVIRLSEGERGKGNSVDPGESGQKCMSPRRGSQICRGCVAVVLFILWGEEVRMARALRIGFVAKLMRGVLLHVDRWTWPPKRPPWSTVYALAGNARGARGLARHRVWCDESFRRFEEGCRHIQWGGSSGLSES
eukprot:1195592-Prorocentrum_minimum.AAC.3